MHTEDNHLVHQLIAIKNKEYLSWEMISKSSGITRYTLHRLVNTTQPIRLMTLRKLKAFVEHHNATQRIESK